MAKKKKRISIETNDQNAGGSFNAHKHWKKLREKHRKHKKLGLSGPCKPEIYEPSGAGKGDGKRSREIPNEVYDINWDLAFGKISKEEHNKRTNEFWEQHDEVG